MLVYNNTTFYVYIYIICILYMYFYFNINNGINVTFSYYITHLMYSVCKYT